ncbi:MAG: class I adenylate-forming enzyme family protein [Alphaproteobacteria bacterium]
MPLSLAETTARLTAPGAPFEMVEGEALGRRMRLWKYAASNLREPLLAAEAFGDDEFIVYQDERVSYGEFRRRVNALAAALQGQFGVAKGDRVAIAMRNLPEWPVSFFAATAIGAVAVPLNGWWTGPELHYGLADSGAKVLIADAQRWERARPRRSELTDLETVILVGTAVHPEGTVRFAELTEGEAGLPDVAIDPDDPATIFYTSGTTGFPKGALGTHRNIATNAHSLAFGRARTDLRHGRVPAALGGPAPPKGCVLLSVPFFHVTGCHSTLLPTMIGGGKLVLMYRWNPEQALELIERERVTAFGGVPGMAWQVLESPDFAKRDTSSILSIGYGGAPSAPELVKRLRQGFPQGQPGQGYGLTETSSVTTQISAEDYVDHPDSCGPAVPVCDVRVIGEAGETLPVGAVGELLIYGPNIVQGYWNKPAETAASFVDGWLRSGDLARLDDEGFIYIVDRVKDVLIRGGENVYCSEVENALYSHPAVMDATVVGLPHRVLGEEVGAAVQVAPGAALNQAELQAYLKGKLAAFKIPVRIDVRDTPLPRNANGKIMKPTVREEMLAAS